MKIDNFALTMHQACPSKYQLRMIEGWRSKQTIASEAMLEAVESHASRFDGPSGT